MFPRQDVGVKGSTPVQECLRQPVYAEVAGILGNVVFNRFRLYISIVIYCQRLTLL